MLLQWNQDSDYSYLDKGVRLHDWAWEFLRRNPDYRVAYEKYAYSIGVAEHVLNFLEASRPWGLAKPSDPLWHFRESGVSWSERVGPILMMAKIDPWPDPKGGYASGDPNAILWDGFPERAVLSFDLRLPIEPQVEEVRGTLLDCQKRCLALGKIKVKSPPSGTVRADHYKRYIRLLDGSAAGASQIAMGKVLCGDKANSRDSARRALTAARRLSRGGYRDLLLRPNRLTGGGEGK